MFKSLINPSVFLFMVFRNSKMRDELKRKGFETILPYIEIYGHWTKDESKLETDLLICLLS